MMQPRDPKQESTKMRYRNDNDTDNKKRRYRKKNGKCNKAKSIPEYFSINATVLTWPRHECSVFRGSELRQEITVDAVIHGQDNSAHYPLRFTSKASLETARNLRPGDKIHIVRGRFDYRHKRAETELRVAEFIHS